MSRSIKEHYPTPSSAIRGMVKGLREIPGTKVNGNLFKIGMGTFGENVTSHEVCFGCAATCTVLNADPNLPVDSFDRRELSEFEDLVAFEGSVDCLRRGQIWGFLYFYLNYYEIVKLEKHELPYLGDNFTDDELEVYLAYADYLESKGY